MKVIPNVFHFGNKQNFNIDSKNKCENFSKNGDENRFGENTDMV